jgi:hypothetical protein
MQTEKRTRKQRFSPVWRAAAAAFIVTVAACCSPLGAEPADSAHARSLVTGWLRSSPSPLGAVIGPAVERVETFTEAGEPVYYAVYLFGGGFVIVPADTAVEPIIAFAARGIFNPSADNPLGALVSRDVPARVRAARSAPPTQPPDDENRRQSRAFIARQRARQKWTRLRGRANPAGKGRPPDAASDLYAADAAAQATTISEVLVPPLVESQWSQGSVCGNYVYNYYTPDHIICGCVATAMAQVMRYHSYPDFGVGTGGFTIYVEGNPQTAYLRGGDGAGGPYNWNLMSYDVDCGTSLSSRQAIGAVCYDAGVSVGMSYSTGGSGATLSAAKDAMTGTFGYSRAVYGYKNGDDIGDGLQAMLNPNMDAGYPAMLAIESTGDTAGHAVVCDGYGYDQQTLYHHINMGWGGSSDAWYNLPSIPPYSIIYACVYNLFPQGYGEIVSGRVFGPSAEPLEGAVVTGLTDSGGSYGDTTNAAGIYALTNVPSGRGITVSAEAPGMTFFDQETATSTSRDYQGTSGNAWPVNFIAADTNLPERNALQTSFTADELVAEGSPWRWTGTGVTEEEVVSFPETGVMLLDTGPNQRARWVNDAQSGFGAADRRTGFTAEVRMKVIKSTYIDRGFDFELYAGDGSASGNRYLLTVTTAGLYWYSDGQFERIASGLDNFSSSHIYRLTVLASGIVQVYRDGELVAVRFADNSVDALLGATGPYFQIGDGSTASEVDAIVERVGFDLSGPYQQSDTVDIVDYTDLSGMAATWLLNEADLAPVPDTNGLVIHYAFDESAGVFATDLSGNGNHGRLNTNMAWDYSGYSGSCLRFGGGARVNVPGTAFAGINNQITLSVWVNGDSAVQPDQNWGMIFNGQSPASWRTIACHCPDKYGRVFLDLGRSDNDDRLIWEGSYPEDWQDRWNHYAFVKDCDSGTMAIYLNGWLAAERDGATLPLYGVTQFTIGYGENLADGKQYPYAGRLDEFRLYDRALTQEQVWAIAEAGKPVQLATDLFEDGAINFMDYAVMAAKWLQEQPWP